MLTKIDPRQQEFDFTKKVKRLNSAMASVARAIYEPPKPVVPVENEYEACIEIAVAVKQAIRASGLSREQVVDEINTYFGRTEEGAKANEPTCRRPLSIHMLNNYLSKPTEYPIPTNKEFMFCEAKI